MPPEIFSPQPEQPIMEQGTPSPEIQTARPEIIIAPHETLGVSSTATAEEIEAAFKNAQIKYHPDKTGGVESDEFRTIKDAYSKLELGARKHEGSPIDIKEQKNATQEYERRMALAEIERTIRIEKDMASYWTEQRKLHAELARTIETNQNYSELKNTSLPSRASIDLYLNYYKKPAPNEFTIEWFVRFLKDESSEGNYPHLPASDRELYLKNCLDILNKN